VDNIAENELLPEQNEEQPENKKSIKYNLKNKRELSEKQKQHMNNMVKKEKNLKL